MSPADPLLLPAQASPRSPPPQSHLLYLVAVAGAIVLLIVVLGVLAAKRKRKHGILWLPDGFLNKKDGKRREPVGQDDFSMKYGNQLRSPRPPELGYRVSRWLRCLTGTWRGWWFTSQCRQNKVCSFWALEQGPSAHIAPGGLDPA